MWSPVQTTSATVSGDPTGGGFGSRGGGSPTTRCKHAMAATQDGHIYLMGGRSGNLPLKDLWRFDPGQNQWEEVKCRGHHPGNLQEHTMIAWNNKLYVFGGEIGFSSNGETALWILDLGSLTWKKQSTSPLGLPLGSSGTQPTGRRGHSAVLYGDGMHVYGGYQDLRGSSSDLWTLDLGSEQWHLMSCSGRSPEQPPGRHSHSALVHDNNMWIYGGMTDLQERSDFWRWDFATETWDKLSTEGMLPNPRCRHTAVANPFLETSTWKQVEEEEEEEALALNGTRVLRVHSKSNCMLSEQPTKALVVAPTKSISMCFGQTAESAFNDNTAKALKYFKFRVHPMSLNLCSRGLATMSDDDDDIQEEDLTEIDPNCSVAYNHQTSQVAVRRSLREKITHSRLVRSISGSSYNILHNPASSTTEALKDELERLVEEATPQMSRDRTNGFRLNGARVAPIKGSEGYQRMRGKMQKSQSSDAVLESESESNTPQHRNSLRPKSELIESTQSTTTTPSEGPVDSDREEMQWPSEGMKRHTVHESMSYYSLCFPSPPLNAKAASASAGVSPSTPNDNCINSSNNASNTSSCSLSNSRPNIQQHRLSSISAYEGPLLSCLQDFDEEEEAGGISSRGDEGTNKENKGHEAITTSALIDLNDNSNGLIVSPSDVRPKSSGYNSSITLYTPSVENQGLPHSMSHCSSGYHSFTDDSIYEPQPREVVNPFQPHNSNQHTNGNGVILRRSRLPRESSNIELKQLNARISDTSANQPTVAENGVPVTRIGTNKESRARSWDRASTRMVNPRGSVTPGVEVNTKPWAQINVIKEVVVPNSPASRKWSYSPAKSKAHQHNWQLCMFVFGGRELGVSSVYKQPISVWKLYI